MIKSNLVSLGARIPAGLKKKLTDYCDRNGIKMQFFITEAVKEKLEEAQEDKLDIQIVRERLKNAEYVDEAALQAYGAKRKKK